VRYLFLSVWGTQHANIGSDEIILATAFSKASTKMGYYSLNRGSLLEDSSIHRAQSFLSVSGYPSDFFVFDQYIVIIFQICLAFLLMINDQIQQEDFFCTHIWEIFITEFYFIFLLLIKDIELNWTTQVASLTISCSYFNASIIGLKLCYTHCKLTIINKILIHLRRSNTNLLFDHHYKHRIRELQLMYQNLFLDPPLSSVNLSLLN
jgi:hypothetical protein